MSWNKLLKKLIFHLNGVCVWCRGWGIISLTIAYIWQLYTLWILVQLHEAIPGKRYNRYVELAEAAFGKILSCFSFLKTISLDFHPLICYLLFRKSIGSMAFNLPNCILICRNRDCLDSCRRRNNETLFRDRLWAPLYFEPVNNGRMVFGFHIIVHCFVSTSKPQLNSWTVPRGGYNRNLLLHHGLGPLG